MATPVGRLEASRPEPNSMARMMPVMSWPRIICTPPSRNRPRRPKRSTLKMETKVATTLTAPMITVFSSDAELPEPREEKMAGASAQGAEERREGRVGQLATVAAGHGGGSRSA